MMLVLLAQSQREIKKIPQPLTCGGKRGGEECDGEGLLDLGQLTFSDGDVSSGSCPN